MYLWEFAFSYGLPLDYSYCDGNTIAVYLDYPFVLYSLSIPCQIRISHPTIGTDDEHVRNVRVRGPMPQRDSLDNLLGRTIIDRPHLEANVRIVLDTKLVTNGPMRTRIVGSPLDAEDSWAVCRLVPAPRFQGPTPHAAPTVVVIVSAAVVPAP